MTDKFISACKAYGAIFYITTNSDWHVRNDRRICLSAYKFAIKIDANGAIAVFAKCDMMPFVGTNCGDRLSVRFAVKSNVL